MTDALDRTLARVLMAVNAVLRRVIAWMHAR